MITDEAGTKDARQRHEMGRIQLTALTYGARGLWHLKHGLPADLGGRWLAELDARTRRMVRDAKDSQDPSRVKARARRKQQRASRRRNRP